MENSFFGFNYPPSDSKAMSVNTGPAEQPKLFSLTSSMNQLENRTNGDRPAAFRPTRGNFSSNVSPFFPGLRRHPENPKPSISSRTNNTNTNANDYENRQKSPQKPFFNLLNAVSNTQTTRPKVFTSTPLKHEQFSSPLSPETPHISSSTSQFDLELGLHTLGGPHQKLPPPRPSQGPESRPVSPAPKPSPESRSRSLSRAAPHRGDEWDEDGEVRANVSEVDGGDMSTIAITALNQVRNITAELTEGRRRSKSLLAQFNALSASHESLKLQRSTTSEELRATREQLKSIVNAHLDEAQALRAERDKAIQKHTVEKKRVDLLKANIEDVKERHTDFLQMKDAWAMERKAAEDVRGARAWAEDTLIKVENLLLDDDCMARDAREVIGALKLDLSDSHHVIDILRDKLSTLSSSLAEALNRIHEIEAAEREAREQFKSMVEVTKVDAEERVTNVKVKLEQLELKLGEKMNELEEANSAAAILRKECDCMSMAKEGVSRKLEEADQKIHEKEDELIFVKTVCRKAEKSSLDARMEQLQLKAENEGLVRRLAEAEEKHLIESERRGESLNEAEKVAENAEKTRREVELRIVTLEERFNTQALTLRLEMERFGDLQERLQVSEEALSKTRETLDKAQKAIDEKNIEIGLLNTQALTLRLEKERFHDLQERLQASEEALSKAEEALDDARKTVDEKSIEIGLLNTQTLTLRLEKERFHDLQERLKASEEALFNTREALDDARKTTDVKSAEIGEWTHSLLAKAEELKESECRMSALTQELEGAREEALRQSDEMQKLRASFIKAKEKSAVDLTSLEHAQERCAKIDALLQEKTDRVYKAEMKIATLEQKVSTQVAELRHSQIRHNDLQSALEVARDQQSVKLEKLYELLEQDRAQAQKECLQRKKEEEQHMVAEDARLRELASEIERLDAENKALREKAGSLRDRYGRNELSDDEKDFAEWLMELARSLHEEEDLAKSNELRHKERFVIQLQANIRELESSLAHLINEKEEQSGDQGFKSMIDLNAFMISSPILYPEGHTRNNSPTSAIDSLPLNAKDPFPMILTSACSTKPANSTGALAKEAAAEQDPAPMKSKPIAGLSFSSLDSSDSEEDIPLSEVSALKTVLGKRDRVSSPAQPAPQPQPPNPIKNGSRRAKAAVAPATSRTTQPARAAAVGAQKKATEGGAKPRKKRK